MFINIFKKIDKYIGSLIFLFFTSAKPVAEAFRLPWTPKKILIIKTVAIGDMVVLLPTIKALKNIFGDAKISLLTTPRVKEVVEGQPFIDEIIYYDILGSDKGLGGFSRIVKRLKEEQFDLSIDLEHYYNFTALISRLSKIKVMAGFAIKGQVRQKIFNIKIPYSVNSHEVEAFFEAARVFVGNGLSRELSPKMVKIATSIQDKQVVEQFLEANNILKDDLVVGVHPGTSNSAKARRWQSEKWAEIIKVLIDDYKAKVIITGTSSDEEISNIKYQISKINQISHPPVICTDFSLKQFSALCQRFNLMISVDTGPMHIAAAMGTKTVGLFGPNIPAKWGPYGYQDLAVYNKLDCSPCTKQYLGQVSNCQTAECMKGISVEDVLEKCQKELG